MKFLLIAVAFIYLVPKGHGLSQGHGRQGIVPLRSTRKNVEQILGAGRRSGNTSVYHTGDEIIRVEYIVSPCKGSLPGWNAPTDTVLQLEVVSQKKELFSELKLDRQRYVKTHSPEGRTYYKNLEEGVKYEVLPDGVINSISYIPSAKDSRLRCAGFHPYDGEETKYRRYDTYRKINFADEEARLDNFAIALQNEPARKGYIIIYAGQDANVREARTRAGRARGYLINKRGVDARRIIVLYGGHREQLETELYLIHSDMPAPALIPTVAPNELQIIKRRGVKKRSRNSRRPC